MPYVVVNRDGNEVVLKKLHLFISCLLCTKVEPQYGLSIFAKH